MVRATSEIEEPEPVGGWATGDPLAGWDPGAEVAFATLCACVRPLLLRYLLDQTLDSELACEIVEETLRRARFGAYARGEAAGDAVAWLLGIADRLTAAALHHRALAREEYDE
jgi:DNA-directed RNA polymerase specialized sigma24 family protein